MQEKIQPLDIIENSNSQEKLKKETDESNKEENQKADSEKDKDSIRENSEIYKKDKNQEQNNEEAKEKTLENPKPNINEESKPKKLDFAKFINDKLKNQNNQNEIKKNEPKPSGFGEKNKKFLEMINKKNKEPDNNNFKIQKKEPINKVSNSIQEKINQMNEKKNIQKNTEPTIKTESKPNSIKEKIKQMQLQQSNNNNTNTNTNNYNFGIKDKIKQMQSQQSNNNTNTNINTNKNINNYNVGKKDKIKDLNKAPKEIESVKEEIKPKIIPQSEILSEENPNMVIYKYPNITFSKTEINNSKIIIFLGKAQELFINTFINIYRNISFKDKFRYKIDSNNIKSNEVMIYDIKSYDIKKYYNTRIIGIPYCKEKNENYIKFLIDILNNIPRYRINLICYTFDENINDLNADELNEIKFYKYFIHYLNLRNQLFFLCSSNESLEKDVNKDYIFNLFNFDKNEYLYEEQLFKYEMIFINNKIIYENDNNTENDWNILLDKFQYIQNKIKTNKAENIEKEKLLFFNDLLINKEEELRKKFVKLIQKNKVDFIKKYKDQFLFIYFLQIINFNEDRNDKILYLYNILIKDFHSHKKIDPNDIELKFIDDKYGNKALNFLSKLNFNKLENIDFHNCELNDKDISLFKYLLTSNLKYFDLSKNHMQDLNLFLEKDIFFNLKILNLSNNNIINISSLSKIQFSNLEKLYLNFNKINDIECFELNNYFDNLKLLDLSNNDIQQLKKVNIKSLEQLNLMNNEINTGINIFMENNRNCKLSKKLNLKIQNDLAHFHFYDNLIVDFEYKIKDKDIEKLLNELNYNGIHYMKISGDDYDEEINKNNNNIIFDKKIKKNIIINILSKFPFNNVSSIIFTQNELIDKDILLLQNLFSSNLTNLDLSNNKINDINGFIENDLLRNLNNLNLSHNNITDISHFSKGKFNKLKTLDLSHNKITSIDILQLDSNFDKLEVLDLSCNLINKLVKINIKNLKELNLLDNNINSGINDFLESINKYSDYIIIKNLGESFLFTYEKNIKINFIYYIKNDDNISEFLQQLSFRGIHYLKVIKFKNKLDILTNESLKELKELILTDNPIDNLSIFKNIHFLNIEKIKFSNNILDDGFDNLKIFPSIKVKTVTIHQNTIYVKFCDPECELYFSNFNILLDDLINKKEEFIKEIIISVFPKHELFSYKSFSSKKLPIFEDIKVYKINISYKQNQYSCDIKFCFPEEKKYNKEIIFPYYYNSFNFEDLNFLKTDDILSEVSKISFSNLTIDDNINFETDIAFKNLKELEFSNCKIESIKIFEQINNKINNNRLKVNSESTICNANLQQYMDKDYFILKNKKIVKEKKFIYIKPFEFDVLIDIKDNCDLLKNMYFKNIESLNLSSMGINNIDFLTNNSLVNLKELWLTRNNIEDISILKMENVHFHKLELLSLKYNPIKKGMEVLKDKFFTKCAYILVLLEENESKIVAQFKYPSYYIDFYINDINDLLNIFDIEKIFFNSEVRASDKLINGLKLSKEDCMDKVEILKFLELMIKNNFRWIYDVNIMDKKNIISTAAKLFTSLENNDKVSSFFTIIDIFLKPNIINVIFPNTNLNNLVSSNELLKITSIDLSKILYLDIKPICECEHLKNVKYLKLCDNKKIENLNELQNSKFFNLKELYLFNDNLDNIDFLKGCPFTYLEELDCSQNNIKELPKLYYPYLNSFNLYNNQISNIEPLYTIGNSKCIFILGSNPINNKKSSKTFIFN